MAVLVGFAILAGCMDFPSPDGNNKDFPWEGKDVVIDNHVQWPYGGNRIRNLTITETGFLESHGPIQLYGNLFVRGKLVMRGDLSIGQSQYDRPIRDLLILNGTVEIHDGSLSAPRRLVIQGGRLDLINERNPSTIANVGFGTLQATHGAQFRLMGHCATLVAGPPPGIFMQDSYGFLDHCILGGPGSKRIHVGEDSRLRLLNVRGTPPSFDGEGLAEVGNEVSILAVDEEGGYMENVTLDMVSLPSGIVDDRGVTNKTGRAVLQTIGYRIQNGITTPQEPHQVRAPGRLAIEAPATGEPSVVGLPLQYRVVILD